MNSFLPTAEELEKLPLRAVVAYAARMARRLSCELRGIVADDILDHLLQLVESVSTTVPICKVDKVSVIRAAERLAGAYTDASDEVKSLNKFRIVFSLGHAAQAAMFALLAAVDPKNANDDRKLAAAEAHHTTRPIEVLGRKPAGAATEAARRDYEILLREYGQHDEVVIGDPVACFNDS